MSRVVGVLGGMGPAATTQFIARVQALTPVRREQDHLRLIVDCNPHVPDRNAAAEGGPSPAQVLRDMARGLQTAGAQMLAMPCNAAHAFADDIKDAVDIPFVDLIEAVADAAAQSRPSRIGVLAADACLEAGLYQRAFEARGVEVVRLSPDDQRRFMELLYAIKTGHTGAAARNAMRDLAEDLVARGAEGVVAGCTEVPLVLGADDVAVPFADSIEILAARTVGFAIQAP